MALNVKLDSNDIPSLLQILGLGGLSRQAAQDDSENDFESSGGVATHPAYGGGGDGAVQRPNVNYSEAHANSLPDNTSTPPFVPPPVGPSLGGEADPTAQPPSLLDIFRGTPAQRAQESAPIPSNVPSTHNPAAPPTKLLRLQQALGTAPAPAPVPQNFEGMPIGDYQPPPQAVPDAGPIVPRPSLADILLGAPAPAVAPPNTFAQNHPKWMKFFKAAEEFAQTAGPGIGAPTFGEGWERASEAAQRRKTYALQNADIAARTAHTQAETQAIINPPGKPNAAQLEFDKAGNILGYRDQKGNLIGPKNPRLPQDVRDMIDAAEQRTTAPTTPEGQVMAYLVKTGKTPAEAYQAIQDAKQNSKPDTAAQNKQEFQRIVGKLSREGGNTLDPGAFTDPRKLATAIQKSKTLTPDEKDSAQSYLATNTTPANQIFVGAERGKSYGSSRPVQVLDTLRGNRPVTISMDELNRAAAEEPDRYISATGGQKAIDKKNLMEDIKGASQNMSAAIDNLKTDFSPSMRVKLSLALKSRDPQSALSALISSEAVNELTPDQQDHLVAVNQLVENAMAMRSMLGAGQGSEDVRAAIANTLPGVITPNKEFAKKQMAAFNGQIERLSRGIPDVPLNNQRNGGSNGNSLAGPIQQGERTAAGPGGHVVVLRSGKWVDPSNGVEVK
jgi:hypothetical protein